MNDATFLLDESLTKLSEVHKYQTEMKSGEWLGASEDHRKEVQMNLHRAEQQALSYMSLGNATVHMMKYLTKELQTPFLIPENCRSFGGHAELQLESISWTSMYRAEGSMCF